jgi:hypothetical protein
MNELKVSKGEYLREYSLEVLLEKLSNWHEISFDIE